jgi:glycosyltransferase involved in cell wall biosynthesis
MKVIFVFEYNPILTSSAAAQRYSAVILEMASRGVGVELWVLASPDNSIETQDIENVSVKYYSNFSTDSLLKKRLWHFGLRYLIIELMIKRIKRDFEESQVDLIWYANSFGPLRLLNAFKNKNVKHILEVTEYHDLHTNISPDQNIIRNFFYRKEIKNFNKALPKLDIILFITNNLQQYYKGHLSDRIHTNIFPMIVDSKRFTGLETNKPSIIEPKVIRYMGSFSNEKDGIDVLLQAFALLVNDYDDLTLELAGGNHADKGMQEELIKKMNIQDKVKYVGMLNRDEIPSFLKEATMLVLARPNSKQAEGGFPTKLGEYLASGIPVCCTRVGEIPNYLKDKETVYFAEPGSISSFMKAMKFVIDNPELAKEVGINGRDLSKNAFGADKQVTILLEYFKKIIDNN